MNIYSKNEQKIVKENNGSYSDQYPFLYISQSINTESHILKVKYMVGT